MKAADPFLRPAPTRRLTCEKCGHSWSPRVAAPRQCPGCHDDWQGPRKSLPRGTGKRWHCLRCGATWISRLTDGRRPVRCAENHCIQWWRKAGRRGVPQRKP